jgi:hypothetical protein
MTMREDELGTYEMLWDCGACGSEKLLGVTHRHCPNCGAAQEASRRYFPSDDEKVAVAEHRYTGVDQQCAACGSPSSAAAVHCPNCGAPLAEGKAVATKGAERIAEGQSFSASKGAATDAPLRPDAAPERKGAPLKVIAALLVIVLALFIACRKKSATLEVVAHHWRLERPIEVFALTTQSAWRDQLPSHARPVECHRETRSTRRVPDGERCERVRKDLGNGAFKESRECTPQFRDEAIDDERCSFQVPAWTRARVDRAEGQGLTTPRRFATEGPTRTGECLGCERAGAVDEVFEVEVREPASGTSARCAVPRARWESLTDGVEIQAQVRAVGGAIACASVASAR